MEFKCPICQAEFYHKRYVHAHLVRKHGIKKEHENDANTILCTYCKKRYGSKAKLADHVRKFHKVFKNRIICQENACNEEFHLINQLRVHLSSTHELKDFDNCQNLEFQNYSDFLQWLEDEESKNSVKFFKKHTKKCEDHFEIKFCCNRSGTYKPKVECRQRQLKAPGTLKMGFHCTSTISVKDYDSHVQVSYYKEHYKHGNLLCHLPLPKVEKELVADSFKSANRMASLVQETSNLGTDSSQSEIEDKARKRSRPLRFEHSSEDDIYVTKEIPQKRFQIPQMPNLKDQTSTSSFLDTSTSSIVSNDDPLSVSSIVPELSQTPQDGNTMVSLFTQVLKSLDQVKHELRCLKEEQTILKYAVMDCVQNKEPIQGPLTLPECINLPAETDAQLIELNLSMRENKSLVSSLVRYLHGSCTGKTIYSFLLSVTKRVIHQNVASLYSRVGKKGKKSFKALKEVYNTILAAAALKFPEADKEELAVKFGWVLASAPEWEGNRKTRKSTDEIGVLNLEG